jgi:hypothetical protein
VPTATVCQQFYNNQFDSQTVTYQSCEGIWYYDDVIQVGESICIIPGTLSGPGAGNLDYVFDCTGTPPTPTPTPTPTSTPTPTPTSPPPTCACYSYTNTTEFSGEGYGVYYTSCLGGTPTVSYPGAGLTITFCAVYGLSVYGDPGIIGGLCNGWAQACNDDSDCSSCGSNPPPS